MHVYLSVLSPVGFLACPNAVVRGDLTQYTPSSFASLYTQAFGFMHNSSSSCVALVLCTFFLSFCCTSHLVHHQNLNLSVHVTYSLSTRSAFEGLVIQVLIYAAFITLHFLLNFLFRFLSVSFCFHFTFLCFFWWFSWSFSFAFHFRFTFLFISFVFCFLSFTMDTSGLTPAWLSFGVLVGFSIVSYTQSRAVRATSASSSLYLFLFIFSQLVLSTSALN